MITGPELTEIRQLTEEYWAEEVRTPEFRGLFAGKEIGHRIADFVDERTTKVLDASFETRHELDAKGEPRARSMGDVWLYSGGIYNPINVKAGEAGKNGQPNMVSLTKLLNAFMRREIDSYYLLIVKMRLAGLPAVAEVPESDLDPEEIVPNVYLVDMLDYLDFVTFDAGPGQAMLKEKSFYESVDAGELPPQLDIATKVSRMIELMEDGDRRLFENRQKKMDGLRKDFAAYSAGGDHLVDQRGLQLG